MNVTPIKAYKSNDGCIWETEQEAITQNIDECICSLGISYGDSYSTIKEKIHEWVRNNKKDIRYILKNIDKI